MTHIGQWMGAAMGASMIDGLLYQRFLSKLISLVGLAVITSIMTSLFIAWLGYAAYYLLVQYAEPAIAFSVIGITSAVITTGCAAFTIHYTKKIRRTLQPLSHITDGAHDIANAFRDGFMARPYVTNSRLVKDTADES